MDFLVSLLAAGGSAVAMGIVLLVSVVFILLTLALTLVPIVAIFAMLPSLLEQARREPERRLRMCAEVAQELGGGSSATRSRPRWAAVDCGSAPGWSAPE